MNDQMARLWVKHMRQYESAPPQKTTMQLWNEFLAAWRMLFGGNKRHLENDSRERQRELDVFWWTRNMSESDALRFVCESNGGLLSGASFEKSPNWSVNAQEYQWFVRNGCTAEQMGAIISRLPRTEMEVWK